MGNRDVKQVIVIRKDLNMRKGKMIAQGCHASLAVILQRISKTNIRDGDDLLLAANISHKDPFAIWLSDKFTKICVSVDSLPQLFDIIDQAKKAKIPHALITDAGLTEFNGVPTETCVGLGPWWSDELDKITGSLKLL